MGVRAALGLIFFALAACSSNGGSANANPASSPDTNSKVDSTPITTIQLSALGNATCSLDSNQKLRCWGLSVVNHAGEGPSHIPADLPPIKNMYVGNWSACVLGNANKIRCWGALPLDLDLSNKPPIISFSARPYPCAVFQDGSYQCFANYYVSGAAPPENLGRVQFISQSSMYGCAILEDQTVKCWGHDFGDSVAQPPQHFAAKKLLLSNNRGACAIGLDDKVSCWGPNQAHQFDIPKNLGPVKDLALRWDLIDGKACALTKSEQVVCWGDGIKESPPNDLGHVVQLSYGVAACALNDQGQVKCWDAPDEYKLTPGTLGPIQKVAMDKQRGDRLCAITVAQHLWCNLSAKYPASLGNIQDVAISGDKACAISDGKAVCWNLVTGGSLNIAGAVGEALKTIAMNESTVCAIADSNSYFCWGKPTSWPASVVKVKQIILGQRGALALTVDGKGYLADTQIYGDDPIRQLGLSEGGGICELYEAEKSHPCWGDSDFVNGVLGIDSDLKSFDIGGGFGFFCGVNQSNQVICSSRWSNAAPYFSRKDVATGDVIVSAARTCVPTEDGIRCDDDMLIPK